MKIIPNNNEKTFSEHVLLVSKTDLKGRITYANRAFMDIVGMNENILIGAPHNIVRHPDMPKIIFKFLWSYLERGEEIHAYVKNICADGSYYWVLANVTPSYEIQRTTVGRKAEDISPTQETKIMAYHSSRRLPTKEAIAIIKPLYQKLLNAEKNGGINASEKIMQEILDEKGVSYEEFILSF